MDIYTVLKRLVPINFAAGWTFIGETIPQNPVPYVPPFDGRTAALRALRDYVCALQFIRENSPGLPPIPWQVKPENFHIDYPSNESAIDFASGTCVVVPTGKFQFEDSGGYPDEASWNQHGPGTLLHVKGTYNEDFNLEFRCALEQQRRSFKGGMEISCSPIEGMSSLLRLKTKGYYGQNATFVLSDGALMDSPDEARGRRTVQLGFKLRIQVVQLTSALAMQPQQATNVDADEATGLPIPPTDSNAI